MGDGTVQNPFTREDVLRLIEENGGRAEGLDLSGKEFEEEVDLSHLDLYGIILKEAYLGNAHFEEANLSYAHLEGAHFNFAHLAGATLLYAEFSPNTKLETVDWGNYVLGEEKKGDFGGAAVIYRRLKIWYTNAGIHEKAGVFFYREREAKRQILQTGLHTLLKVAQYKNFLHFLFIEKWGLKLLWFWIYRLTCGYGERPLKTVISAATVVLGLAVAYYFWGSFSSSSFWDTLYYSAASFTALGYGQWAPQPTGWAKGMGAAEAFIGVFMMALFLVTFVRKMTR